MEVVNKLTPYLESTLYRTQTLHESVCYSKPRILSFVFNFSKSQFPAILIILSTALNCKGSGSESNPSMPVISICVFTKLGKVLNTGETKINFV